MKHVGFNYRVEACLVLTKAEHAHLMERSRAHYDHTCRALSEPGPGSFLHAWSFKYEGQADDFEAEWNVPSRQINIMMKLLEFPPGGNSELFANLLQAWKAVSDEHCRINPHEREIDEKKGHGTSG